MVDKWKKAKIRTESRKYAENINRINAKIENKNKRKTEKRKESSITIWNAKARNQKLNLDKSRSEETKTDGHLRVRRNKQKHDKSTEHRDIAKTIDGCPAKQVEEEDAEDAEWVDVAQSSEA
mgnify:FL=1